jgi:hypothetical protein
VIRAEAGQSGVVFRSDVGDDTVAYIDADWVPHSGAGPVPALIIEQGARVRWSDGAPVSLPEDLDPDRAAALVLAAVARDAAAAVSGVPGDQIAVTGGGLIARLIRRLLGIREDGTAAVAMPLAVVDTTGDPEALVASTRRLADRGMLVLAGEPKGELDLDLYRDVHLRGLELVGIAPPLSRGALWDGAAAERAADADVFEPPVRLAAGSALPPLGSWYCVTGRADAAG